MERCAGAGHGRADSWMGGGRGSRHETVICDLASRLGWWWVVRGTVLVSGPGGWVGTRHVIFNIGALFIL